MLAVAAAARRRHQRRGERDRPSVLRRSEDYGTGSRSLATPVRHVHERGRAPLGSGILRTSSHGWRQVGAEPDRDGMKPMEMAKGCACFIAETPDGVLIIPSEPTPGENTAKRLANTLNA